MYNPADGVIVTRGFGHLDSSMADQWIRRSERAFRTSRKVAVFNDWEFVDSYDSAARRDLTSWVIAHRKSMAGAWFLTGSRLVAMGVAAAGAATALAGVTMHASLIRPQWDRLLRMRLDGRDT